MKKYSILVFSAACLCFVCASIAKAEDKPEPAPAKDSQGRGPAVSCPECAQFETKIRATRDEIKAIDDKMKVLREEAGAKHEAERKAKLDELKQKDPKKYEEAMAKEAEMQKQRPEMGKQKMPEEAGPGPQGRPGLDKEERLALLKEKNPEMYQLVVQRDKLQDQLKALRIQNMDCRQSVKSPLQNSIKK